MMRFMATPSDIVARKQALRKEVRKWRRSLSDEELQAGSARIQEHLWGLEAFRVASQVLCYVDVRGEVATQPIIARLLEAKREVLVPVMQPGGGLLWSRLRDRNDLVENEYGILEPKTVVAVQPLADGCCLVPGLVFMEDGHRLGYGKGYYDRFLAEYDGAGIGLCLEAQLRSAMPMGDYDQKLNFITTEKKTICVG